MTEQWKPIQGYEDLYRVSDLGNVYCLKNHRLVAVIKEHNRCPYVCLRKDLKQRKYRVHNLVAKHFCNNPNNYTKVKHIDGNCLNNHMNNLEWVNKIKQKNHFVPVYKGIKIIQLTLNGDFIKEWSCISEAAKNVHLSRAMITACCDKESESHGDFLWMYAKDYEKYQESL